MIGVVGNVFQDGVNKDAPPTVYWPLMADNLDGNPVVDSRDIVFLVRSPRTNTVALMDEIRRAVWAANPNLPVAGVHTLDYFYKKSLAQTSFTLVMLAIAEGWRSCWESSASTA